MNILVFFLSKITLKDGKLPPVKTYISPDGRSFEGIQTNEAAAKYLIAKLSDSGEKLGKIIAVTSHQAEQNGKDQFIKGVGEFCKAFGKDNNSVFPQIVLLPNYIKDGEIPKSEIITDYNDYKETQKPENIPNNAELSDLSGEAVLADVLKEISPEDTVYLDVSGGRRTDVNMMLLLMKLVKYKGIRVADAFYSDFDGTISSHSGFYRSLDILDGVNQFVTTGNAVQLADCYSSISEDSPVKALLEAMVDFSDSVNLCSLSGIEDTLSAMKSLIDEIGKSSKGGMDMFLFREIIPIIKEKFFDNNDSPDYCQIILWCLENRLIQQAITLYVEKIPKHLFDKGILSYTEELKQKTIEEYKKPEEINLEKDIFFSNLMSCDGLSAAEKREKELVDELKASLADGDYQINNTTVLAAKQAVLRFQRYSMNFENCGAAAKYILNKDRHNKELVIIAERLSKKTCNCPANKIINVLQNDEPLLRRLLNLPPATPKSAKKTLLTKINTINNALEMDIPEGISVNISRRELQVVMLDYLYARQIRNRINHAIDSGDTMPEEFFSKNRIDYSFSMKSIISQLRSSVEFILNLKPKSD